jgi:hypothetical protein
LEAVAGQQFILYINILNFLLTVDIFGMDTENRDLDRASEVIGQL